MAMTFSYFTQGQIQVVVASWTSDSSGDASGTTEYVRGTLLKGVTKPSGAAAPTDNYDITITDNVGSDVLGNCVAANTLANRDTANTEAVYFLLSDGTAGIGAFPVVNNQLTITVANAGDTKSGTLYLYYRNEFP